MKLLTRSATPPGSTDLTTTPDERPPTIPKASPDPSFHSSTTSTCAHSPNTCCEEKVISAKLSNLQRGYESNGFAKT